MEDSGKSRQRFSFRCLTKRSSRVRNKSDERRRRGGHFEWFFLVGGASGRPNKNLIPPPLTRGTQSEGSRERRPFSASGKDAFWKDLQFLGQKDRLC